MLRLDHIVVACERLEEGRSFVEDLLGTSLQAGGQHELMGTHNLLLGVANGLYLEVIAVDPDASAPDRPRWFGLDEFRGPPRLTNWVCRSDQITQDMGALFGAGITPVQLSRGDLSWQMSVLKVGQTPFDGLVPMLLDWGIGPKAADRLEDSACGLKSLTLGHPKAEELRVVLNRHLDAPLVKIVPSEAPFMRAILQTPRGEVLLS